ncbi:MAG TPA: hypothetical protein DEV64_09105 [Rhodospirillaceae bacterium]|nr:hypothetical protein [Rhodospirillaceae bacterium]|tara:strand:- start:15212 stop:15862 length:651 start_codon:yes stop_codon:yes gene_type:complete
MSDLLAKAQLHAKGDALHALQELEATALSDHISGMNDKLLDYAERLRQAEEKVASGAEIMRISELLTLAQFGAGSIGSAIAAIYRLPSSATGLEALYVSKFLTELVVRRREYPALIPADLLRKYAVEREEIDSVSARPVLAVIVERARETATRVSISGAVPRNAEFESLVLLERKLLEKRLRRLLADPCDVTEVRIGFWDRIIAAVSLHLRKKPSQ